ncbi:MAG: hypothetical protein VX656_14795 [Candidatus Latescibacterota bacterium]|nr:hypothetical protein [Candidatus Latescibacterota bacterium]
MQIRTQPFDKWQYMMHLHEMTPSRNEGDWRITSWAVYMEFSLWSLIFMALSGVYLWLASRPGHRWAQICFGAGTAIFILFYAAVR